MGQFAWTRVPQSKLGYPGPDAIRAHAVVTLCQQRVKSEQIAKTMDSVDRERQHAERLLYAELTHRGVAPVRQHAERLLHAELTHRGEAPVRQHAERLLYAELTHRGVAPVRQHAERLLYAMIPRPTAIRLKNGEDPINTWEVMTISRRLR